MTFSLTEEETYVCDLFQFGRLLFTGKNTRLKALGIEYFGQTPMKKLLFFPFHDTQNLPKNENVEKEEIWNNSVQINVGKR